ncbi:MAG: succinylglutamate desuccinylase/aspartoacylase family protein [Halobacteria archaeon]|nr:succinylglutamate desuccinylase/aspartoacylase family protein [Halobacteria archaeon]
MLEFGTARAGKGEKDTGRLTAGELRDGTNFGLPVAAINGVRDGKTLYIQAASDGNELNGVAVVRELVRELNPKELSGNILAVGVLNYHGFQVAEHKNPIDRTKLNRVFPGSSDKCSSHRLVNLVYENGVKRADFAIDLHQGSTSRMIDEVRVRCGSDHSLYDECMDLGKTFGTEYLLDKKGPEGQLARVAPDEGVPTVNPELGGSVGLDRASVEKGTRGVYNVLKEYGFLDGEPSLPQRQVKATGFDTMYPDYGGLLNYHVDLYDKVEEGDPLFDVTDMFGDVKETVEANNEGVVWRTRRLPMVSTGEYVMSIGTGLKEV